MTNVFQKLREAEYLAHSQDNSALRAEIEDLRRMIWLIVDSQGGTVHVSKKSLLCYRKEDCFMESEKDERYARVTIRAWREPQ